MRTIKDLNAGLIFVFGFQIFFFVEKENCKGAIIFSPVPNILYMATSQNIILFPS